MNRLDRIALKCPERDAGRHEMALRRAGAATAALLGVAAVYWIWFGLTQRSIVGDDGISLLAARGILDHGYPRLPSGFLYARAYVPEYLLAASIAAIGWNDVAIMLPSLGMALTSVWLTVRIGAEILGRPLVGLTAAAFLVILQAQTFYATSARMYMPLQTFTLVAVYAAWRGFARGERRFQLVTALAIAAAVLSHQQGGALLLAVPLGVLAVRAMQGAARPPISGRAVLVATALLWLTFYAVVIYQPESGFPSVSMHSGVDADSAGLNLNVVQWVRHVLVAERMVPLGVLFAPALVWLVASALRAPGVGGHAGLVFATVVFVATALAIVANVKNVHWRFWVMLLPLQVLLVTRGAAALVDSTEPRRRLVLACGVWAFVVLGVSAAAFGPGAYAGYVVRAYGLPCRSGPCSPDVESQHASLRAALDPGDTIVSTNPMVTYYYLRRVDGFLRERRDGDRFTAFESRVDEYLGIPLIDERSELEALRHSSARVWVVVDHKARSYSSPETLQFLAGSFARFASSEAVTVYVNAPGAALARPGAAAGPR